MKYLPERVNRIANFINYFCYPITGGSSIPPDSTRRYKNGRPDPSPSKENHTAPHGVVFFGLAWALNGSGEDVDEAGQALIGAGGAIGIAGGLGVIESRTLALSRHNLVFISKIAQIIL